MTLQIKCSRSTLSGFKQFDFKGISYLRSSHRTVDVTFYFFLVCFHHGVEMCLIGVTGGAKKPAVWCQNQDGVSCDHETDIN